MIIGVDTSCYTTSLAVFDPAGRLLCEKRRLLPVAKGHCGLRQSEALFCHVKQLPELMEELAAELGPISPKVVCVSARPRPVAGSYMPVFLAGLGLARSLAASCGASLYQTSHQEGHIAAALWSAGLDWQEPFLALHLSGGTGEILRVAPKPAGYDIATVGDTDLPPGQFVDRVGVALGLPFPAGPELEKLAERATGTDFRLSGSVRGTHISFSGPESAAERAIASGVDPASIAAAVLDNIAKSLAKAIAAAREQTGCQQVLLAGGVAANRRIRKKLAASDVSFAAPEYAGDNACGVALLGLAAYRQEADHG